MADNLHEDGAGDGFGGFDCRLFARFEAQNDEVAGERVQRFTVQRYGCAVNGIDATNAGAENLFASHYRHVAFDAFEHQIEIRSRADAMSGDAAVEAVGLVARGE